MVLGKLDVARTKPKTPATRDGSLQPAGSPRPPLSRWATSTRPGARRALGMGDDVWRGQTDGSVEEVPHALQESFVSSDVTQRQGEAKREIWMGEG